MSRFKMIGLMIAALCFALLSCSNDSKEVIENGEIKIPEPDVIYNPDNETVFPNPERGFAPALEAPKPALFTWDFCEQDEMCIRDSIGYGGCHSFFYRSDAGR